MLSFLALEIRVSRAENVHSSIETQCYHLIFHILLILMLLVSSISGLIQYSLSYLGLRLVIYFLLNLTRHLLLQLGIFHLP